MAEAAVAASWAIVSSRSQGVSLVDMSLPTVAAGEPTSLGVADEDVRTCPSTAGPGRPVAWSHGSWRRSRKTARFVRADFVEACAVGRTPGGRQILPNGSK